MKHKLTSLAAAVGLVSALAATHAAWAAPPATGLTSAAVDAYLDKTMESTGLPGMSVVVTHRGEIVHAGGYGRESDGEPVTARTPMRVASVSKSFTAMAVMTLVDDGRISLDEPVARQLPEFRMADRRAAGITVRQLLNQTSGLSDTTVDIGATQAATSLAGYVSALGTGTLAADPGTRWEYCNVNYDVAARLVEVAGGRSFGDYMEQRVFGPLGMTGSAVGDRVVRPSEGFNSVYGAWVARPELPGFRDGGAGGVVTNAADMGRWLINQTGGGERLVTPESLRTMHTPSTVRDYGMGWGEESVGGTRLLVHSGNLFTYTAVEAIAPDTGYGFAVMTNGAALHDDTYDVLTGLVAMSRGGTPDVPGGGRQTFELVLGLIALAAAGLGALGVLRSRRWASGRAGSPGRRIGLRLASVLLPVALFAGYPWLISFLMNGRTVTWEQLTYFAAPMTITFAVVAAAGAATAAMRLARLRSVVSTR
ncbi:serine hydrolase domain-containing protein [Streptosporangium sp. NBC_01469]|uniref:serine hydrolase domain-containing protein n=1 Tax=Streptosporangium sp. NBC_01469 TaxID=2903898 RepID=UPI002E2E22EA|nr:serine hydrolase domain-containing protein [Streptosporangium sp. NBC_01469]